MMYCILNACLKAKSCRTESRIRAQKFHKITRRLYGNLGNYIKGIPPPNFLSVSIVGQRSVTAAAQKRSVIHHKNALFKQQQLRQKRSAEEYNMDLKPPLFQSGSNRFRCTDLLFFFTAVP